MVGKILPPGSTSQSHYIQWLYGCLPKDGRMASSASTPGGRGFVYSTGGWNHGCPCESCTGIAVFVFTGIDWSVKLCCQRTLQSLNDMLYLLNMLRDLESITSSLNHKQKIWTSPFFNNIYNNSLSFSNLPGFYSWLHHLQFYHRRMSSLGPVDDSFIPSVWDASAEVSELAKVFEAWRLRGF